MILGRSLTIRDTLLTLAGQFCIKPYALGHRPPRGSVFWPWIMYICKNCYSVISANQPSFNFPIEKRTKRYPKRIKANLYIDDKGKEKLVDDPGGIGSEIVREIQVCKTCFDKLKLRS